MAGNLITSVLSLATNLLHSIRASVQAPSSSSNYNNSERESAPTVEDLERLMRTLKWIQATLYDADEREIIDRSTKFWLKELKKIAYDAEDVLSEYQYEVTRLQVEKRKASQASGSHKRKQMEYIENIVQIPNDMVDRVHKIRSRFDEIAKDREALQLVESDGVRRPNNKILQPPTGHMVDEANIFGRDAEIKQVIDFLLSEKEKPFSIISIIGKGGLGKTTIAQLVYKDERVTRCFDLFGWVCVSEEFDIGRLTKAIIESVDKINCGLSELSSLQEKLVKTVEGKTVLLVLDDVWNTNQSLWEIFRVPFKKAKLVRILITTRDKKIAKIMQTTTYFRPTNLSNDLCWQLFQHYAFSGTSDTIPKHLADMGREIMKKCGGLPLAVKSIASLLRYITDEEHWREILESDLWEANPSNDIFPALQISYAHLPPHLKPCFLFCSMYPKDYILQKRELIQLWISHGYIESCGRRRIEEIAGEYYEELQERSFLDESHNFFKYPGCCKLHDIIHDLARINSENEHYSVEFYQPLDIKKENIPQEACHLYVGGFNGYVDQILQQNLKGLRTLSLSGYRPIFAHDINNTEAMGIYLKQSKYYGECPEDVGILNLTKFKGLRVLELRGLLTKIPHSISELKHLTYLSISSSYLRLLPSSIGILYNLTNLILDCPLLEYLPESIGHLPNLLRLLIKSDHSLNYIPHGPVLNLKIMTMVAWLRVGTVAWLEDMKDLKGILHIEGLANMINLVDAQRANLRNKCNLGTLDLCWDPKMYIFSPYYDKEGLILSLVPEAGEGHLVGADVDLSLLDCLQPHPNLKKLRLRFYPSARVPGWMRDPFSLQSIQEVLLQRCDNIQSLPFRNLHKLKHLIIDSCSSIQIVQLEQLSSPLEELKIFYCGNLELITGLGDMDKLATLKISFCGGLKALMMDGFQLMESHIGQQNITTLTRLEIKYCYLLCVLPDGLVPSGPCSVYIHHCGCPDLTGNWTPAIKSDYFDDRDAISCKLDRVRPESNNTDPFIYYDDAIVYRHGRVRLM